MKKWNLLIVGIIGWWASGPNSRLFAASQTATAVLRTNLPLQAAAVNAALPPGNQTRRGLAVDLGDGAVVLYDTELLRVAGSWVGSSLVLLGLSGDSNTAAPSTISGDQRLGTRRTHGWIGAKEAFEENPDARPGTGAKNRWLGAYVVGDAVIMSYSVRGMKVLEQPAAGKEGSETCFIRTLRTEIAPETLRMMVCELPGAMALGNADGSGAVLMTTGDSMARVGATDLPAGARLQAEGSHVFLVLPKGAPAATFNIIVWSGPKAQSTAIETFLSRPVRMADFGRGGARRWSAATKTAVSMAASSSGDGAYVIDRLGLPVANPWGRRVLPTGFDFFSDGTRAALCTADGDVWVVTGIDTAELQWQRFGSGLMQPGNLKVIGGNVCVATGGGILRLQDLNGDGEADLYANADGDSDVAAMAGSMKSNPVVESAPRDWERNEGAWAQLGSGHWGLAQGDTLICSSIDGGVYLATAGSTVGKNPSGLARMSLELGAWASRVRINSKDGQAYITGAKPKSAASASGQPAGFERIRFNGKPYAGLRSTRLIGTGTELGFSHPLDAKAAVDLKNYTVTRWLESTGNTAESSVVPAPRERVQPISAKLGVDSKSVVLQFAGFKAGMGMEIKASLKSQDGKPINTTAIQLIKGMP